MAAEILLGSLNPWVLALTSLIDILEIAGIIPDPFQLLIGAFAGKPRELSTVTVIQRLFGSQNPAGILWGLELYKLFKNQNIVLSSSSAADQAELGSTRHQFKASLLAQDILPTRIQQIVDEIYLNTTSGTQPVPPELRVPWHDANGNPTWSFCGGVSDAITAAYNARLAFNSIQLGGHCPTSCVKQSLLETFAQFPVSSLVTLVTCEVVSTICQQPGSCQTSFGCEGLGPNNCFSPDGNCVCTSRCGPNGVLNTATGQCFTPPPPSISCPGGEQDCTAACNGTSVGDPLNPGCCVCTPSITPPPPVCNPPMILLNGVCQNPPAPVGCPSGEVPWGQCGSGFSEVRDALNHGCSQCIPITITPPPPPACATGEYLPPCNAGDSSDPQTGCCIPTVVVPPPPPASPCTQAAMALEALLHQIPVEAALDTAVLAAIASGSWGGVGTLILQEWQQLLTEGTNIIQAATSFLSCIGLAPPTPPPSCQAPFIVPGPNNSCPIGFTFDVTTECCKPLPPPPPTGCPIDQYPAPCLAGDIVMSPTCCHVKIDPPMPFVPGRRFTNPGMMLAMSQV